ncbi:hypothetical protein TeGR_g7560, partial [Tetraparma gracilis]
MQESDAIQTIYMSASDGDPMYISLGEHDSELLITTDLGMVLRRCLEGTGCDPQTRNSVMMQYGGSNLKGIGVLDETYIVADKGDNKIYECPFTSVGISNVNCEVFADKPRGMFWDPCNVLVDPIKRLVFVVDNLYTDVLVLDFDGAFLAPLASSRGALIQPRAMAQRPGLYAPISPSHPPSSLPAAGERIEVALAMMDAYNSTVSNSHPTSAHDLALEVSATGYITGTNFTTTIAGAILYDEDSPAHASLTASVVIPYAGDWSVSVTQGTYKLYLFHTNTQRKVAGSPIGFDVVPDAPSAAASTASAGSTTSIVSAFDTALSLQAFINDAFGNEVLDTPGVVVQVQGLDSLDPAAVDEHVLEGPRYSHTVTVPEGLEATLTISFSLDGTQIGEPVKILVAPPPPDNTVLYMGIIFGGILVVFGVSNWLYSKFGKRGINAEKEKEVSVDVKLRKILDSKIYAQDTMTLIEVKASYRQIIRGDDPELAKALDAADGVLSPESIAIRRSLIVLDMTVCDVGIRGFFIEDLPSILLNSAVILLEMGAGSKAGKSTFASFGSLLFSCLMTGRKSGLRQARRELRQKKLDLEQVERMQGDIIGIRASHSRLQHENEELEEEVRLKKHSEEDLKVMVAALEAVSKERQDELKEVMMESKELKIDRLLGKGGFGVVNLATYQGTKVAMKQLLKVNEENVLRFRHECFLMKNLSHPNVVKLVGVCWSEDLFACCLEFVENGSLEDWLRRTVGGKVFKAGKGFTRYAGRSGESFTMIEINAKPAQIMAYHTDASRLPKEYKGFDVTAATRSVYGRFDQKTVGVSNRDALTRSAITDFPDGSIMESARSIEDKRYPDRSKKKKDKIVRMDVAISAFLVMEKETSTSSSPVSVCYRLSVVDPKFTGLAAALNRIAAKAAAKLTVAPMLTTKTNVEKIVAAYDPNAGPELPLAEVTFKGFDHSGEFNTAEHTDMDRAKKKEAEELLHEWWMQRMNPKMGWTEMLKEDESRLDHGMSGYH